MKEVLGDIQSGGFARDWIEENRTGKKRYDKLLQADLDHPIEQTGKTLRALMPWLQPSVKAAA